MAALTAGTREVLHDLIHERGLTDWRVVVPSTGSSSADAVIYGRAHADRFDESRALRKRKPFPRSSSDAAPPPADDNGDAEPSATWCCFLVLATNASSSTGQLSIQRLVEMEEAATASAPEGLPRCERTFLCLTDAANVSYYHLGCEHAPPRIIDSAESGRE